MNKNVSIRIYTRAAGMKWTMNILPNSFLKKLKYSETIRRRKTVVRGQNSFKRKRINP